ncbi:hypothetical protein [Ruegeria atlantica]|uniref:hypothetical protein n=1 Tax=Ruegeria atlantica TaxID=81569 RepID=UPI0024942C8C|nr:hypothetical protein [Ruegeria atlantica]
MSKYKLGDKSKGICSTCEEVVSTTFTHRDVPLDDESATVPGILAGVCDQCDTVVSIPGQSTPEIKRVMDQART